MAHHQELGSGIATRIAVHGHSALAHIDGLFQVLQQLQATQQGDAAALNSSASLSLSQLSLSLAQQSLALGAASVSSAAAILAQLLGAAGAQVTSRSGMSCGAVYTQCMPTLRRMSGVFVAGHPAAHGQM
jgi:hypothetical protein